MWWGEILGNGKGNTSETKLFQHYCFLWFSMFQSIHNSIENFTKLHSISQYAIMFLLQKIIAFLQVFQMSIKQHKISKWMKTPYRWRWRGGGGKKGGSRGRTKEKPYKTPPNFCYDFPDRCSYFIASYHFWVLKVDFQMNILS